MDYLKTIKLGYGAGTPGKQACWMTALSSHIGGEWTDRCNCVDPTINRLCIEINDAYADVIYINDDDDPRTRDILEFGLFEPLGTADRENEMKRYFHLVDRAVRQWAPWYLKQSDDYKDLSKKLEALKPIVDKTSVSVAATLLISYSNAKKAGGYEKRDFADYGLLTALKDAANADYVSGCVLTALKDAACASRDWGAREWGQLAVQEFDSVFDISRTCITSISRRRVENFIKQHMFPVLRELIDMGKHGPYDTEPACGVEKFKELVGCNKEK